MNNEQLLFYNKGFNDCLRKVIDTNLVKTLTDEEIIGVFESPFNPNRNGTINSEVIAFARAILRKAQEK